LCALGGALAGGAAGWGVNEGLLDEQDDVADDAASGAIGAAIGAAAGAIICADRGAPAPEPTPCQGDADGDGVMGDGEASCPDRCPNTPTGVAVDSDGCPKVGETLLILEGVNFAFDSAKLTPESESILSKAVQAMQDAGSVAVRVEGHTDSVGSDAYNRGLSERRAEAVAGYLTSQGIASSRMEPVGLGESEPVASNGTEDGRYKNRRVEFEVIGK
jgi:OOP family OmpA-OmpF porin